VRGVEIRHAVIPAARSHVENRLQQRLAELNGRLAHLQARDNPADAEEFVRLDQECRDLLKKLESPAAREPR